MPSFKTLDDLDVRGRRVLVRADLNVPLGEGRVTDTARLDLLAPTVAELSAKGARVVLLSHLGRPKGAPDQALSLDVVREPLSAAIGGRAVAFAADCVGPTATVVVDDLGDGEVALLENLRFHAGEESNDPDFARALADLGDVYVNDAFSAAHRAHASTEGLARLLPAAAGRLMQAELEHLGRALESPARPLAAIVGGAKVSTKLELLGNLVRKVDHMAIGGGMANTFLHARGVAVGRSLCERDMAETARDIEAAAAAAGCAILLPSDGVVAAAFEEGAPCETLPIEAVPANAMILDIGPATVGRIRAALEASRTLVWNGPLGAFEIPPFDEGTNAVAHTAAALTRRGALLSVAGGGDTMAALAHAGVVEELTYVSSAGGAFLEWLEGRTLPGVAALEAAASRP